MVSVLNLVRLIVQHLSDSCILEYAYKSERNTVMRITWIHVLDDYLDE